MKKPIALVISIVLSVGQILNPATVLAMTVDDVGGEYWYIPEVIEYDREVTAEIENHCAGSPRYSSCLTSERVKLIIAGGNRYQAISNLRHHKMLITSVNPYRSTIRVHYIGTDRDKDGGGLDASELYIYWLDESKARRRDADKFVEQFKNGELEDGVHVIYAETRHGDELLIARREEVRLVLPAGSLTGNTGGTIFYAAVNDAGEIFGGGVNYLEKCLTDDSFDVGQECRGAYYMINNTHSYYLVPYDEVDEDRGLEISPLVTTPESAAPSTEDEPVEPEPEDEPESEDGLDELELIPEEELNSEGGESSEPELGVEEELEKPDPKPEEGPTVEDGIMEDEIVLEEEPMVKEKPILKDELIPEEAPEDTKPEESEKPKSETGADIGTPKTPNTGEPSHNGGLGTDWCLPMTISLGVAYIIWWIIPVGKKRRQ